MTIQLSPKHPKYLAQATLMIGAAIVSLILGSYSWAVPERDVPSITPEFHAANIDYRHMSLYDLKQRRYYGLDSDHEQVVVNHVHHHDHWGWGGFMGGPCFYGGCEGRGYRSFGQGVTSFAATASVLAVAVGAIYGIAQAAYLFWPYTGGSGLTSVELAADSPWVITDYRLANGYALQERDFAFNPDALAVTRSERMYDRKSNSVGQFLLLDQENWWGVTDYPIDAEITFSKYDANMELAGDVTIHLRQNVTNGLTSGIAHVAVLTGNRYTDDENTSYRILFKQHPPALFAFDEWYHRPNRVILQIESTRQN